MPTIAECRHEAPYFTQDDLERPSRCSDGDERGGLVLSVHRSEVARLLRRDVGSRVPGVPRRPPKHQSIGDQGGGIEVQYVLLALGGGAIYGLLALGLVVIHRGSGVLNFAISAIGMVGTYVFWQL